MENRNKKRDPIPPPDATPEEIGEFWDMHNLADYWDETHEVEFQVNLKENLLPEESEETVQKDTFSAEQSWQKLKELIQSMGYRNFEKLVATLLTSFLQVPFVVARAGDQPRGDARSVSGDVSMQAKRYTGKNLPDVKTIEGDIGQARRSPALHLQVYVLAVSRDTEQLSYELNAIARETGVDIVTLELSDELSDIGALCVTFWENICHFFDLSNINQEFSDWIQIATDDSKTKAKIEDVRSKLEDGIQTQKHVQEDIEEYLLDHFSRDKGFNPINLSEAVERKSLESEITDWWETTGAPVCCLEGEEGHGKSWLAAKCMNTIRENENVVTFWLDSKDWSSCKSVFDLLYTCFNSIYLSYDEPKIAKLQNKPAKIWRKTLIVLDGVNEWTAIEAAQRILTEYFKPKSEWRDRIRFLLTTRPLDDYPDFESYLWDRVHKISVDPFNDSELQEALTQKGLQLDDLPDSLKDIARIPRYFQRCAELRDELGSFDVVTKEMVLWADLLYKIKYAGDLQIRKKLDWQRIEEAQDDLAKLAKEAKWTNINKAPQASVELLTDCFSNYHEIRRDLEEQRITLKTHKREAELSKDHIVLGWALYLANLFDCTEFTGIKDFAECFQNALEPIPPEDLRTKALFVALQITAISPAPDIPQDQLSQKRAALMLAWFNSHNAQITNKHISFWVQTDTDAYAQVVKVQLETHNSPSYEEAFIGPLAKVWLHQTGQIDQLRLRLTKWFLATSISDGPEDIVYVGHKENQFPREKDDIQSQLSCAAISILSQRPDPQFLETLARCYESSGGKAQFREDIGRLMRWGYTEAVLDDLCSLAEQAESDESLLEGIYGLANCLCADLPQILERPLTEEDLGRRSSVEKWNRRFKPYIDRIRNQERLLIGDSPAANGNYHGLDHLAVRTDLPDLHHEDLVEIKKILKDVSLNAKLGRSVGATLEDFCIENLMPWVAKCDFESYAELACDLKFNTLNQEWAQFKLLSIQGLIFTSEDCERITESILGMKQRLAQGKNSYQDIEYLTSLLTEVLLFSASEKALTDWFEFLASHEPLRVSICYDSLPSLLQKLLPESIVRVAQRKLETLRSTSSNGQDLSLNEAKEFSEEEYWCTLYAYSVQIDENAVKYVLEDLKMREPDSTGTFPMLRLALSDPKRFLDEALTDERIQSHLFSDNGRRFILQTYDEGKNVPSYEVLRGFLPPEIVGNFLLLSERRDDLSRWGKDLMDWMYSILQGIHGDSNAVENIRFAFNPKVLKTWAEQNTTDFWQLADKYFTELSKSQWYDQGFSDLTDAVHCLLLRFRPDEAMKYYHRWKTGGFRTVYRTHYGVETFIDQLWRVKDCNLPEHHQFRRELLEECLNDEEIMFMTLAALAGDGEEELWNLVTQEYLVSPKAKERNLGVSILPWFGNDKAIRELKRLKSDDPSQWVREHAAWAYEVAQQERSCREVYREALQTRDLFRVSAVFERIKPALSPIAQWWHYEIEDEEKIYEESQNTDPKLVALVGRFWYRWGNSSNTTRNIEVFRRKLREYCRGEKLSGGFTPRLAPWWKPSSD